MRVTGQAWRSAGVQESSTLCDIRNDRLAAQSGSEGLRVWRPVLIVTTRTETLTRALPNTQSRPFEITPPIGGTQLAEWRNVRRAPAVTRCPERGSHRLLLIGEVSQLLPPCGDGLYLKDQSIVGGHVRRLGENLRPGAVFICGHHSRGPPKERTNVALKIAWPQPTAPLHGTRPGLRSLVFRYALDNHQWTLRRPEDRPIGTRGIGGLLH